MRRIELTGSGRTVARAAIVAVVVLVGPGAAAGRCAAADLEREVVIVATGGAFEQALKEHFYAPFSKATSVAVRPVAASAGEQWAKVKAMAAAGKVEWDIVSMEPDDLIAQRQFLDRVGCNAMPNVTSQGVAGACQEYGLLRTIGGGVITYSTRAFHPGQHPRSWADFWDVRKFPGPRALQNAGSPWWVLAAALTADGVPPERLFPLDLDRAFRKLDEIKPHVRVWWKTGDQSQQLMRDGEVVLSMMWSGRALALKNAGVSIEVDWNQAIKDVALWGVLKDAPHPKAASAFLNFFMDRPEAHLAFSRQIVYDTSNRKALELLPAPERPTRPTFDANWKSMLDIDYKWVADNRDRIVERWNAWLAR